MKKFSFLFFISIPIFCSAQEKETITPKIELSAISQINQGNSYITFPTDIGNIEHLWFEGNLIPNFFIKKNKNSRLIGVLTPQIIIRMYQKESFPVQTPSYIPQISVYYSISNKFIYKNLTLFGRLAHHSNGQEGDFYSSNGTINLLSGNFTTNYFETGLIKTNFNTRLGEHQFFRTSIEIHPQSWMSEDLVGKYSSYRWHTAVSFFKIGSKKSPKKASISLKAEAGWMFGGINNWKNFSSDRLNFKLTFFYHPEFFNEIGLFAQFYHGMDYYNIYFNHHLGVIRFGIMTEILNF
jgi:hypothetical protein